MATAYPEPAQKMLVRRLVDFWIRPFVCVGGDLGCFRLCCFGDDLLLSCPSSLALPTSVGPLVRRNGVLPGEPHWAHGASVGLLPSVRPLVPRNVALHAEAPRAHGAGVGLLPRVRPLVRSCFALRAELLWAERATKRGGFRGVDPLVLRQLAGTPEPLLTVPTQVYHHCSSCRR